MTNYEKGYIAYVFITMRWGGNFSSDNWLNPDWDQGYWDAMHDHHDGGLEWIRENTVPRRDKKWNTAFLSAK